MYINTYNIQYIQAQGMIHCLVALKRLPTENPTNSSALRGGESWRVFVGLSFSLTSNQPLRMC